MDIWKAAALHIALQVQRFHQPLKNNKGKTFLVFDEHKQKGESLAEMLFSPPRWTDDYYSRDSRAPRLDQIIDTAFYARSHHVGLVQIADLCAFVFKRHVELQDHAAPENFEGEKNLITTWVQTLANRLIDHPHRWPKRTSSDCAKSYVKLAPQSLLDLS